MPTEHPERPPLHPFVENAFRVIDESIFRSTVGLLHAKGTTIYDHRSGVLVRIADKRFLVTAGHYLRDYLKEEVDTFILKQERGSHPPLIQSEKLVITKSETVDLAVVLLDDALVEYLGPQYQFLHIPDFAPKQECRNGWYFIVGFPKALINPDENGNLASLSWKYATRRYAKTENVLNYNPRTHLVVKYENDTNDGERIVHPPCMSGCGIWYLDKEPPEIITARDLKLCAIQTAWHERREYSKGTWTDSVLDIMWHHFPELQEVMRSYGCRF